MTTIEILLIGVALSMDAVAISITNGMVYTKLSMLKYLAIPLFFGVSQGLMPLGGYFVGGIFADIITKYSGVVILLILGVIGVKMIKEGVQKSRRRNTSENTPEYKKDLLIGTLFVQSVATSIDAFAVGVGFNAVRVNIFYAASLIALTTMVLAGLALIVGRKFGDILGSKAEIFGGVILIVIGVKAVF